MFAGWVTTPALSGRVLLLSSDDDRLAEIEADLTGAGYEVTRCVAEGAPGFPCVGLTAGACPLDAGGGVDVALDVRVHPWPHPTPRETGVSCAVRAGVPLVVIGSEGNPFAPWAVATLPSGAGIAERCDDAIEKALEAHRAAAADAVAAVLANHGCEGAAYAVDVRRRQGRLNVRITADAPADVRGVAATRAAVALRLVDSAATAMEIEVVAP